ncbi:hypothetical protein HXY33_05490 [Candidatus Bathyarchaeota archaeon]|nr:hypothetical protein [Candidatus Bathyarchaeota archaeon]
MENYITIEETLTSDGLPEGFAPFLLLSELLWAEPVEPTVWLDLVIAEDASLVGKDGTIIKIPKYGRTQSVYSTPAATFEASPSFTYSDLTITSLPIEVVDLIYVASKISKILTEDVVSIDWIRLTLQEAGVAIKLALNAEIRDLFISSEGTHFQEESAIITYGDIIDGLKTLKVAKWFADEWFLIISPEVEASLLKDTMFISTERYTTAELESMVDGEVGKFAGCRVVVDVGLEDTGFGFIVAPEHAPALLVWKRKIESESVYKAEVQETWCYTTARYKLAMVKPSSVLKFAMTSTP